MRTFIFRAVGIIATVRLLACVGEDPSLAAATTPGGADGGEGEREASAPDDRLCDPAKPFEAPIQLQVLNSLSRESSPRLSRDELQIYFTSNRVSGGEDFHLFTASRAQLDAPFEAPVQVQQVVPPGCFRELNPMLTTDGAWLLFMGAFGPTGYDLVASRRTEAGFGTGTVISGTQGPGALFDGDPWLAGTTELWFTAEGRDGGTGADDLYRATFDGTGGATNVHEVQELNTTARESLPVVSDDGLTIYFASERTDGESRGGFDVWTADRPNLDAPFRAPTNVKALNTGADDMPGYLSVDGCRLYLSRRNDVDGGSVKESTLLLAKRPK